MAISGPTRLGRERLLPDVEQTQSGRKRTSFSNGPRTDRQTWTWRTSAPAPCEIERPPPDGPQDSVQRRLRNLVVPEAPRTGDDSQWLSQRDRRASRGRLPSFGTTVASRSNKRTRTSRMVLAARVLRPMTPSAGSGSYPASMDTHSANT